MLQPHDQQARPTVVRLVQLRKQAHLIGINDHRIQTPSAAWGTRKSSATRRNCRAALARTIISERNLRKSGAPLPGGSMEAAWPEEAGAPVEEKAAIPWRGGGDAGP